MSNAEQNFVTQKITLPIGLKIKDKLYQNITIREEFVEDMQKVERDDGIPAYMTINFRKHLYARCIVKIDGFDGFVTPSMLSTLKRRDWNYLTDQFDKLSAEGKPESKAE